MTETWFQSEEDRMKDHYQWSADPLVGSSPENPVLPIETSFNKHKRYYDLSVQYGKIVDLYAAGKLGSDDTKLFHLLRLKTPLPEYESVSPHNGR